MNKYKREGERVEQRSAWCSGQVMSDFYFLFVVLHSTGNLAAGEVNTSIWYSEAPVMFRGKSREGLGYRYYRQT